MSPKTYMEMARAMPGAEQSGHFDVTDFRVKGKIFATLREKDARAVLKLTPDQQTLLGETAPEIFAPIKGSWGQKGWTQVDLANADAPALRHAMEMAWRNVAPKRQQEPS
jgi:hypothetical protein